MAGTNLKEKCMSYCRWSCDDYKCDVYCYEDCGGFFYVGVADVNYDFKEPLPDKLSLGDEGWLERHNKVLDMCENADKKPIGLSRDGESFKVKTAAETAEMLESLKAEGYNVPDYAIEALKEEANLK